MCLSFAVLSLLIAVKRVLNKRQADFKVNYHVQQISNDQFEAQKRELTQAEIQKLRNSKEYQNLVE